MLSMNILIISGAAGEMSAALRAQRLDENAYIKFIEQRLLILRQFRSVVIIKRCD
jgi:hypothetical protein